MAHRWTDVEQAVLAGDADRVADVCIPLAEAERGRLAPAAQALVEQVGEAGSSQVYRAAQTALLCLGPAPEGLNPEGVIPRRHPAGDRLEAIVRSRPREWRDRWAKAAAAGAYEPEAAWRALRSLLRTGDCERPDGDGYPQLMLAGLRSLADGARWTPAGVADVLREDPGLLVEDVWLAFRVSAADGSMWPPSGKRMFPMLQRVLVALAADGTLSRERLVGETLAALRREEHNPGTARALAEFHDRVLKPTTAELAAHHAEYLRWLESDRDAMTGFALAALSRLDPADAVDGRGLLDRLGPLVALRAKAHARRAVVLAGRVVDREPALAAAGLEVVTDALAHESAEVQRAAVAILERHAARVDSNHVGALVAAVDPSLRDRVERLAGAAAPPRAVAIAVPVSPATVVDPDRVPRLLPVAALAPVEDVEELLDLASLLLEGLGDPDEAERFADGLSRLCDRPVPAGRRTAVQRRARRGVLFGNSIATLTHAWLGWSYDHQPSVGWSGPMEALGRRLTALARRLTEGRAGVLLSAPTHRGGFLDAEVLAERLARGGAVEDHDLAQAILRLPVPGRDAGLERIAATGGEPAAIARALRDGTGGPADAPVALPASWDSAAVLADPGSVALDWQGTGNFFHGFSYGPAPARSPARALAGFEPAPALRQADGELRQRWLSLVWPGRRDLYLGTVLRTLRSWSPPDLDLPQRRRRFAAAFTVMRPPDEPLGPHAVALIALALLEPDESRLAAAEVVAEAIADRRLVPAALGRALAAEAVRPGAVPNRLGAMLQHTADRGPLHAHEVQQVIEAVLAALGDHKPKLASVTDLLRRLAQDADARVADPAARAWLESQGGRPARAALDVTGDGAVRSVEAAALADAAERDRARRWAAP